MTFWKHFVADFVADFNFLAKFLFLDFVADYANFVLTINALLLLLVNIQLFF